MIHPLPPVIENADGDLRRIGVELELHGLPLESIADIVAEWTGGERRLLTDYEAEVSGDDAGLWRVEFDYEYLKNKARKDEHPEGIRKVVDDSAEDLLRLGAEQILPMEVVSPPFPMDRLSQVDSLIGDLRDAGAKGTRSGLIYAFGTHLNPELPALDASTITAYLRAFLCLYPWLRHEADVDLARRLSQFIEPFDDGYVRLVCDVDYQPGMDGLIDDYLRANPTRNRVLDMLPLFAHVDEARVRGVIDDPRIKARPTLHYRMPNCEIDRQGWGIGAIWQDWLQVEHLAADESRLREAARAYTEFLSNTTARLLNDWSSEVERWLVPVDGQ